MNDHGDVVGLHGGFRGFGDTGWVGRLFGAQEYEVFPSTDDGVGASNNLYANAVIQGTTELAPQGGVSVGGYAEDYDFNSWPVVWTCLPTS